MISVAGRHHILLCKLPLPFVIGDIDTTAQNGSLVKRGTRQDEAIIQHIVSPAMIGSLLPLAILLLGSVADQTLGTLIYHPSLLSVSKWMSPENTEILHSLNYSHTNSLNYLIIPSSSSFHISFLFCFSFSFGFVFVCLRDCTFYIKRSI